MPHEQASTVCLVHVVFPHMDHCVFDPLFFCSGGGAWIASCDVTAQQGP